LPCTILKCDCPGKHGRNGRMLDTPCIIKTQANSSATAGLALFASGDILKNSAARFSASLLNRPLTRKAHAHAVWYIPARKSFSFGKVSIGIYQLASPFVCLSTSIYQAASPLSTRFCQNTPGGGGPHGCGHAPRIRFSTRARRRPPSASCASTILPSSSI